MSGDVDFSEVCERVNVALCLYSKGLNFVDLCSELGIEHSLVTSKFRDVRNPNGHYATIINTEYRVQTLDARDHIDWLLNLVSGKEQLMREMIAAGTIVGRITCHWWSKGGSGPVFSPPHMAGIAALGLDFWLDVSFYGDEED